MKGMGIIKHILLAVWAQIGEAMVSSYKPIQCISNGCNLIQACQNSHPGPKCHNYTKKYAKPKRIRVNKVYSRAIMVYLNILTYFQEKLFLTPNHRMY